MFRYWTGLVLLAAGAWLLRAGLARRRRNLGLALGGEAVQIRPSLAAFGAIMRPIILCGAAFVGLKMTLIYVILDGGRLFSVFDIAGMWALLAGYGAWLMLSTDYEPRRPRS